MTRPSYLIHHITRGGTPEVKAAVRNDRDGPVSDASPSTLFGEAREIIRWAWTEGEILPALTGTVLLVAFMFFASVLYVGN